MKPQPHQTPRTFAPHVTVATVIEQDGKFLFVEELSGGEKVINQPAGHLEANETLAEAALRETLEETGWKVQLTGLLSVNLYHSENNGVTYQRTTFCASPIERVSNELDDGIIRAVWLSEQEARHFTAPCRSPLVLDAIARYQQGMVYPLDILGTLGDPLG